MKFESLRDVLKFAIAKEESSVLFYKALAERVKRAETTAVFEALARQEQRHIEAVKLELFKLGYSLAVSSPESESNEQEGSYVEVDDVACQMSYIDALRLGIQKERAAFKLYAELMAMAEGPEARKVFMELAEEETRHVIQLEREIELMTHPRE